MLGSCQYSNLLIEKRNELGVYRRFRSPVLRKKAKIIKTAALVSYPTLETIMILFSRRAEWLISIGHTGLSSHLRRSIKYR